MPNAVVVVPCFNEAARLDRAEFARLAGVPGVRVVFVNDGSIDSTEERLRELAAAAPGRIGLLSLDRNHGKGEAVRRGLLRALEMSPSWVGYLDADLSTPVEEMVRLIDESERRDAAVILGARVLLLGTRIQRRPLRHYLGRVFASVASLMLDLPVYDTQCGAKLFRVSALLREVLAAPFKSRWAFDVELIGRLLAGTPSAPSMRPQDFVEIPLRSWSDVRGSKLQPHQMLRAGLDLLVIGARLRARRR